MVCYLPQMENIKTNCFESDINARLLKNLNLRKELEASQNASGQKIASNLPRIINSNLMKPNESLPIYSSKNTLPILVPDNPKKGTPSRQSVSSLVPRNRRRSLFVPKSEKQIESTAKNICSNTLPIILMKDNTQKQSKIHSPANKVKILVNSPRTKKPSILFPIEPLFDIFNVQSKSKGILKNLSATNKAQVKDTFKKIKYYETLNQAIGVTPKMSVFNEPTVQAVKKETPSEPARIGKIIFAFGLHTTHYPKVALKSKKKKKKYNVSVVKVEFKDKGKHEITYQLQPQESTIDLNSVHQSEKSFFNQCVAKFQKMKIEFDRDKLYNGLVGMEGLQNDTEEEKQMRKIALKRGNAKIFIIRK